MNNRKERKKAYKLFNKRFKKDKQELIKLAKRFQVFDYSFTLDLLFKCVEMLEDFYSHPELLMSDYTEEPYTTQYKEFMDALYEIAIYKHKYESCERGTLTREQKKIAKQDDYELFEDEEKNHALYNEYTSLRLYFEKLSKVIMMLWD